MNRLEIFDPAQCCSTGVCGPSVDPRLVKLAADVAFLKSKGVTVERFNLAHQPGAFMSNPVVLAEMGPGGEDLPLFVVEGRVRAKGQYPSRAELSSWFGIEPGTNELKLQQAPACDCGEDGCC